jgi:hypothetical protein
MVMVSACATPADKEPITKRGQVRFQAVHPEGKRGRMRCRGSRLAPVLWWVPSWNDAIVRQIRGDFYISRRGGRRPTLPNGRSADDTTRGIMTTQGGS